MGFVFWIGVNWLIGYAIGKPKERVGDCVLVSVLLGPIGWIIALLLAANGRTCPQCAEVVKEAALVCKHCGFKLNAAPLRQIEAAPVQVRRTQRYAVAKNGQQIGTLTRAEIQQRLRIGGLELTDYYFDEIANDWLQLDLLLSTAQA